MTAAPATEASPAAEPVVTRTPPATPTPSVSPTPSADLAPTHDIDTDVCAMIAEPGEPMTTLALVERIDPAHAPHPANESEMLLFRQLYETLVRVDCEGQVRPALAASWRLDADQRTWIVTLRDGAHFTDGTAVTAAAVRKSWAGDNGGDDVNPRVRRLITLVVVIDDRTLAITMRNPRPGDPLALAHTDLAIAMRTAASPWPLGTRDVASPVTGAPVAIAEQVLIFNRDELPAVRVLVAPRDPRDLLGAGIDLLLTRDPATLAYAATLPEFQSVPLEWQRTQVLLQPERAPTSPALSDDDRRRLAADAIQGEARGAEGPFWWDHAQGCDGASARVPAQFPLTPRVVYDGGDAAAHDLAERLVAVTRASGPASPALTGALLPDRTRRDYQRAVALTGTPLVQARTRGADAGYIVSVDRRPLDPCRELAVVIESAPWLDRETIMPIADTRLHAIVRRGTSGVTKEWDGGLLMSAAPNHEP